MKMKNLVFASLRVMQWIGGIHWQGCVEWQDSRGYQQHSLSYNMSRAEARRFNRYDNVTGIYQEGTETTRFWAERDALQAAVDVANDGKHGWHIIGQGGTNALNPGLLVWTHPKLPQEITAALQAAGRDMEALREAVENPWASRHKAATERIEKRWEDALHAADTTFAAWYNG